jgi:hypothetical protein
MDRYTTDAVGFLLYLIDDLGAEAEVCYRRAERNDCVIELPTIAVVETLYRVGKNHDLRGQALTGTPEEVVQGLEAFLPVAVVECRLEEIRLIPDLVADLSIHDAMIVASHRARETEGVITTGTEIGDLGVPVVWD